jgi:hypothetical protein
MRKKKEEKLFVPLLVFFRNNMDISIRLFADWLNNGLRQAAEQVNNMMSLIPTLKVKNHKDFPTQVFLKRGSKIATNVLPFYYKQISKEKRRIIAYFYEEIS